MLNTAEWFVQKEIQEAGGLPQIEESVRLLQQYAEPSYCYYKSKNLRLDAWNPDKGELYEIVIAVFTFCLSNPPSTYQMIAGSLVSRIGLDDEIDCVKTAAECIAVIARTGLIQIERTGSGHYIMVSTTFAIEGKQIPEPERHVINTEIPELIEDNRHPETRRSLILGGRQNHHDGDICRDHLNRMNRIELKLNRAFLRKYSEAPTCALETTQARKQWEDFIEGSYRAYISLVHKGNRFDLEH